MKYRIELQTTYTNNQRSAMVHIYNHDYTFIQTFMYTPQSNIEPTQVRETPILNNLHDGITQNSSQELVKSQINIKDQEAIESFYKNTHTNKDEYINVTFTIINTDGKYQDTFYNIILTKLQKSLMNPKSILYPKSVQQLRNEVAKNITAANFIDIQTRNIKRVIDKINTYEDPYLRANTLESYKSYVQSNAPINKEIIEIIKKKYNMEINIIEIDEDGIVSGPHLFVTKKKINVIMVKRNGRYDIVYGLPASVFII